MTNWLPDLSEMAGPLYVRLANRIEEDIEAGTLPAGAKLPPQRNLAFDIGVTVGTVSRAYALVRERGLISGEVGRGTYVTGGAQTPVKPDLHMPWLPQDEPFDDPTIRLDSSAAFSDRGAAELRKLLNRLAQRGPDTMSDYIRAIEPDWRSAGAQWIEAGCGWRPEQNAVTPVHGAHGGIMAIIAAMTNPGDRIATEALTYGTVPRCAHLIGRRTVSVAVDDFGIIPEALETVCAQQHPRMLFLMPAVHNPLTHALPADRRAAIIDIARRHNLWIIEDSLYGTLGGDPYTPLAALAPDITFHISGLSKAVAASLRAGWVAGPPALTNRIITSHKMMTGGDSYVLAAMAAELINSGAAFELQARIKAEVDARLAIVRDIFDGCDFHSRDHVPFIWLKLPEPWLSGTFKAAALEEGVRVDDEDEFKAGRGDQRFHGVRIAFAATVKDHQTLEKGARILRRLLDTGPAAYHSYN